MDNRETFVAAIAQHLAPKLYAIAPEKEGFPIYDTREEVEDHLNQQLDPVGYWTEKAGKIAEELAICFEAGGVDLSVFDYDKAVDAFMEFRTDLA